MNEKQANRPDPLFPNLARNVRFARIVSGHTQESLARTLGVTLRTIQNWESGTRPARKRLEALATELDREPIWFLTGRLETEEELVA